MSWKYHVSSRNVFCMQELKPARSCKIHLLLVSLDKSRLIDVLQCKIPMFGNYLKMFLKKNVFLRQDLVRWWAVLLRGQSLNLTQTAIISDMKPLLYSPHETPPHPDRWWGPSGAEGQTGGRIREQPPCSLRYSKGDENGCKCQRQTE